MEDGGYRTHERVKCFVKRHLGQRVCDSLRVSEPCIVVGDSYAHAFKFIVLTDDTVFILANPPQADTDIERKIELQQIKEINNVHDVPDFLSGELQKNALHFCMLYEKENLNPQANLKPEQKSNGRKSPNLYGSSFGSRTAYDVEHQQFAGKNSSSRASDKAAHENERTSTIRFRIDEYDDLRGAGRERSYSDPLQVADLPATAKAAIAVPLKLGTSQSILRKSATKEPPISDKGASSRRSRPLPPPAPGTEMTNAMMIKSSPNLRVSGRRRRAADRKAGECGPTEGAAAGQTSSEPCLRGVEPKSSPAARHRSFPQDRYSDARTSEVASSSTSVLSTENNGSSKILSQSLSARIGNFFGKSDDKGTSKGAFPTVNNTASDDFEEEVFPSEKSMAMIDVYLLNGDSQLVPLLKSTRINSIMSKTLQISRGNERSSTVDRSKMLEEFNLLKEDILNCTDIEKAFILTKELLTGATKRPLIKILFWKTQELMNHYNAILDSYLFNHTKIVYRGDEADELDFMLVIADLVICMIFNTEILQTRNKTLFGHRGSIVYKLMKVSLLKPDLLKKQKSQPLSNAATLLLAGVNREQKQTEKEIELKTLLGEWTDACSSIVYELLNATDQCSWAYREGKGISLHSLISTMESHPHVESFLQEVIGRILNRLHKGHLAMKHSEVVLLYRQFTVLLFIFENSPVLSKYLLDHYFEEFRYYIGAPKTLSRIPECPVAPMLRAVMAEVVHLVVVR